MKTQFIINAQTQFLRDTIKFYHSGNRAVRPGGTACIYEPTDFSPGCAIGRHIPNKAICRQLVGSVRTLAKEEQIDLFGPLLVLGTDFLQEVQSLHDEPWNWTGEGLGERGLGSAQFICDRFSLDQKAVGIA